MNLLSKFFKPSEIGEQILKSSTLKWKFTIQNITHIKYIRNNMLSDTIIENGILEIYFNENWVHISSTITEHCFKLDKVLILDIDYKDIISKSMFWNNKFLN